MTSTEMETRLPGVRDNLYRKKRGDRWAVRVQKKEAISSEERKGEGGKTALKVCAILLTRNRHLHGLSRSPEMGVAEKCQAWTGGNWGDRAVDDGRVNKIW